MRRRISILAILVAATGCTGSRWARDDPDYAAKYPTHTDNIPRTIKQAIDARHLRDKGGVYASVAGRDEPAAIGGEVGGFYYPSPYVEGRLGLSGLVYDGPEPVSGGLLAGARLQSPTRVAPFVGIGGYAGATPNATLRFDGIDNNFDGYIDNDEETENEFVGALTPEAGCHFWINPAWRVTGSASYFVTTAGPDNNFLMINISLARLNDLGKTTSKLALRSRAHELGWKPGDGPGMNYPTEPNASDDATSQTKPLRLGPLNSAAPTVFPWEITQSEMPTAPDYTKHLKETATPNR